jgi:hypothetical protein
MDKVASDIDASTKAAKRKEATKTTEVAETAETRNPKNSVIRADGSEGPEAGKFYESVDKVTSEDELNEVYNGVLSSTQLEKVANEFLYTG